MTHKTSTFKNNQHFSEFQATPNSRIVNHQTNTVTPINGLNSQNLGPYNYT